MKINIKPVRIRIKLKTQKIYEGDAVPKVVEETLVLSRGNVEGEVLNV